MVCGRRSVCATGRGGIGNARDVYLCRKPLVGWERVARLAPQVTHLHYMVALTSTREIWICDFLPIGPTDPWVLGTLLTMGEVPGEVRVKRVKQMSEMREYVGCVTCEDVEESVMEFNAKWNKKLKLMENDCRDYAITLAQHLTEPLTD